MTEDDRKTVLAAANFLESQGGIRIGDYADNLSHRYADRLRDVAERMQTEELTKLRIMEAVLAEVEAE